MSEVPGVLPGADDTAKLAELSKLTYKQQAIWYLNAYWEEPHGEAEAENLWLYKHKMDELDLQNHEDGCCLDEMKAHVFLEHFKETMTVREVRWRRS